MPPLKPIQALIQKLSQLPHNQYWQLHPDGVAYLQQVITTTQPKTLLEIGTSSGYSSLTMLEALLLNNLSSSHIYTVESHPPRHQFALANFQSVSTTPHITAILGHAPEILTAINFPNLIDLLFLDCTKSQTLEILQACLPLLNPNSHILIDNVQSHREKFTNFLTFLDQHHFNYQIQPAGTGICHIQKV